MKFWTLGLGISATVLGLWASHAQGEVEVMFQPVGADTQVVFPHAAIPGATGIDFSFSGIVDGGPRTTPPPTPESHILVTVFEWGPTATGPWSTSPDNVNSIPVEMGTPISTGVFHGPAETPFVAIHFYAGNLMTVSGTFTHVSAVPEAGTLGMGLLGGAGLILRRRRRG